MQGFSVFIKHASKLLNIMAGMALVAMTALTCIDVILRFFGHPILGTYEVVGLLGAILNAFALPETTRQRGHVRVEVLVSRFPKRIRRLISAFTYLLGILLFLFIGYAGFQYGLELKKGHEVSMTLQIPLYPIVYAISLAAVMVSLVLVAELIILFQGRK